MGYFPDPDPSTGQLTPLGQLEVLYKVSYIGAAISLSLNLLGLVLFYYFRQNRKFPISVLGWIGIVNVLYSIYIICKWHPESSTNKALVLDLKSGGLCFFSIWADQMFFESSVALNTIIAVIMFISIVKRIDVSYEADPKYFWIAVAFFWIASLTTSFSIASSKGSDDGGFCTNGSTNFAVLPLAIMIFAQLILITMALLQVKNIISTSSTISTQGKKDRRLQYMVIRFALTIFIQILSVSADMTLVLTQAKMPAAAFEYCIMIIGICMSLDAGVLIFLNRPLLKVISTKIPLFSFGSSDNSTGSGPPSRAKTVELLNSEL